MPEFWIIIPDWLLRDRELPDGAKILWGLLDRLADQERRCKPNVSDLANEMGISRKMITRRLKMLEKSQLIQRERMPGKPDFYHVKGRDRFVPTDISVPTLEKKPLGERVSEVSRDIFVPTDISVPTPLDLDVVPPSQVLPEATSESKSESKSKAETCTSSLGGDISVPTPLEWQKKHMKFRFLRKVYRKHIFSRAMLTGKARAKIKSRLKKFSLEDLETAIKNFAAGQVEYGSQRPPGHGLVLSHG